MTYEMSNIRKQLDDFKSILKESEQPIPDVSGAQSIEELIEIMQTHPRFNRIGTLTSRIIPKFQREKEAVEGNYARMGPEDTPRQAMLNLTPKKNENLHCSKIDGNCLFLKNLKNPDAKNK